MIDNRKVLSLDIGIMGSGQLGWMMILEGRKLKNRYFVLDKKETGPASAISDGYFPLDRYREFVEKCDVVTYEFEHVSKEALEYAESKGKLFPPLKPVLLKKDRASEKDYLVEKGFPVARYKTAESLRELKELRKEFGKCVIKSAGGGYDGKGQVFLEDGESLSSGISEGKYVIEDFIDFKYEASVIASRDRDGNFTHHAPSYNYNRSAILVSNAAPVEDSGMVEIAERLMKTLDYVGVMGIEFYIVDGRPVINEFAPRVHNTGHHTLHGSSISQFEQHVRAISGLPVPRPVLFVPSGIINIIGIEPTQDQIRQILSISGTRYYWYAKDGVRKKRKVGHVNATAESYEELRSKIEELSEIIYAGRIDDFI